LPPAVIAVAVVATTIAAAATFALRVGDALIDAEGRGRSPHWSVAEMREGGPGFPLRSNPGYGAVSAGPVLHRRPFAL
jgi:hypothetical protein